MTILIYVYEFPTIISNPEIILKKEVRIHIIFPRTLEGNHNASVYHLNYLKIHCNIYIYLSVYMNTMNNTSYESSILICRFACDCSGTSGQDAGRQEQVRADVQARQGAEAADDEAAPACPADDPRHPRRPGQLPGHGHAVPPHQAGDTDTPGLLAHLLARLLALARGRRGGSRH